MDAVGPDWHGGIIRTTAGIAVALGLPVWFEHGVYDAVAVVADGRLAGVACKQHLAGVFPRQALHAERLALQHPANRESCEWTAALPADMSQLLARAGIDFTAA